MMAPSVLFVAEPTVAGVAQCVADWSEGLAKRDWRVAVACPSSGWLGDTCRSHGVAVHTWEAHKDPQRGVPGELRRLQEIVAQANPDVLHLNGAKAGFVGRLLARGRHATAFSPHSWAFDAATGLKADAALRWERFAAARWTGAIIAVSQAEATVGERHGIRARYVVARNGINLDSLQPVADRAALRASLGIAADEVAVVCVGRMHRQKGQDLLLQAWPAVAGGQRTLHLVGGGPLLDDLRRTYQRDDVAFLGDTSRPAALQWMQAADVMVVPSRWEGMALVPLESLAMGTAVVASDVTGVREAIGNPTCGVVVPPGSVGALAQALNAWLAEHSDDAARPDTQRDARRRWIAESFNLDLTVDIIEQTLTRLIAEHG